MITPETINVMFSDEYVVVVDKPSGVLTTPAHGEISLVDILNQRFFGRFQLFVVHRLDRETSGLLVFARTPSVAKGLAEQFAKHSAEREYVAVVAGHIPEPRGCIEWPVNGKKAKTHYEVIKHLETSTYLLLRLSTGRRNQIRYHLSELGFPIIGDERIGGSKAAMSHWPHKRIALHAKSLRFWHPVLARNEYFEATLPLEFARFLVAEGLNLDALSGPARHS